MKILKSAKNSFFTTTVFVGTILSCAYVAAAMSEKEAARDHVAAFFKCAQEELAVVKAHIANIQAQQSPDAKLLKQLKKHVRKLMVLDCIARRDSKALEAAQKNELEFYTDDILVWVNADRCTETVQGRLVAFTFDAENALPFVLYHSALDITDADRAATLAILNVLFDKGLAVDVAGCSGYWLKNEKTAEKSSHCCCDCSCEPSACNESSESVSDYVGESSLVELAEYYSFKEAQELVARHCSSCHENSN